ncbi:DUF4157 domain-containing protein [Nostoc sp.]|uniref:eCIS core domain-containing protein n=1 Tax=Nostoc sp. TaxID=1180 RepID=UPI0035936B4B
MRERIGQPKKATTASFSMPTLKEPTRGFGLESNGASSQATSEMRCLRRQATRNLPLGHDISRISLRSQTKLTVNRPRDVYEQEADKVAAQVMQTISEPVNKQSVQREELPEQEEEELQMKSLADSNISLQREELPEEEEELQMKPLTASPQAVTGVQPSNKPLTHDISRMSLRLQTRLTVNQPGDIYEQEADRVAGQVMQRMSQPGNRQSIQREALPESEELQMKSLANSITPVVQRQGGGVAATSNLETSIQQARGTGQPLADDIRQPMEQSFGTDFSGVKIHTDNRSDQLNQSVQARAFTTGQDIFFRQGEYAPESHGGKELLAHELTHVVQQNGGAVQRKILSNPETKENKIQAKALDSRQSLATELRENPQKKTEQDNQGQSQQIDSQAKTEAGEFKGQVTTKKGAIADTPPGDGNGASAGNPPAAQNKDNPQKQTEQDKQGQLEQADPKAKIDTEGQVQAVAGKGEVAGLSGTAGVQVKQEPVSNTQTEQVVYDANGKKQPTTEVKADATPKLALLTPDIAGVATQAFAPTTNGVQPDTQTPQGTTDKEGSDEFAQFLQQADAQREGLLQSAEQKKQQIRATTEAQKQNAQQSISTEEKRLEEICNQAIERIEQSTARTRTQILSDRDAKVEATRTGAQNELNNLKQTVLEKQNALRKMGDNKATAITSVGQEQSQRAIKVSNQKASQAQTFTNNKAQQYASSEHGSDIASGAQQMAAKAAPGMQKAGDDMAQAASKGANELASSFQNGASQLAQKFNQALEEGQIKILQVQDQTISVLNQMAQESVSQLEASNNEAITKLQAGKQNAVQQLRTSAQGAISNIDKSAENCCSEVDQATTQATGKLSNFTDEVSTNLSANQGEAGLQTVQAAQTQLSQFRKEWDAGLNRFGIDATQILQDQAKEIHDQISKQVEQAADPVQKAATDFETKATDAYSQVSQKMGETVSKATETMHQVTGEAQKELQKQISESESKFNTGLDQGKVQLTGMVDQGLAKHDEALSQLSTNVSSMAVQAASSSILGTIGNFLKGVWDGFWDAIGDIFKGIGSLLSKYWENLKKGDFWTWVITIVVVIVVAVVIILAIVFPPFGAALLGVLAVVGKILLYGGIIIGAIAALYYVYKAIFTPNLSAYERGKYAGRALFEILLLWLSWKGIAKGASTAGKAATAARLAELVPDAKLLARLEVIVQDQTKLIELLETWKDAEKLAEILEKAGDVGKAEALLKQFGNIEELWQILQKPGVTAVDLEDLLKIPGMNVAELKDLLKLPGMTVTDLKDLLKVSGMTITDLQDFLTNPAMTVGKLKDLLKLPGMTAPELKNFLTMPGMTVEQLEKLVALTDNAPQLKRLLQLLSKAADLELYMLMAGGKGQAARLTTLLEKAAALGDVKRVESLLNLAGGNTAEFERLANTVSNFNPPTGGGTLSNLHGYSGAEMAHFEGRHTFNFDFVGERIKLKNTLWPQGTDVAQMLEEALTLLDKQTPPFRLAPNTSHQVTLSNNTIVQLTIDSNNKLVQFFPVQGTGVAIDFTKAEMQAFNKLLAWGNPNLP